MPDIESTLTQGVEVRGYRRGAAATDGWDQYVIPVEDRIVTFDGRSCSFVTLGRATTTDQVLHVITNATGSTVLCSVTRVRVDLLQGGAAKASGTIPPVIRVIRVTGLATGGTAIAKGSQDTNLTSNASVVVTGDASADGTNSATALSVTQGVALAQVWAPRIVQTTATAANLPVAEFIDTAEFLVGEPEVILRPGEGLAVILDVATAAGNPATDRWISILDWIEYTRP